ncbi:hypothetical protein [Photobacterium leiognathi]|uniref:hypothetical protein n=1 Tax=Photobacterium leiognathi TaxID=553611 RepID=UPI002732960A|nr:hypothetical protein [Photobacterium leiognathi]
MNMQHKKTLLSLFMMLGLSGCGGGGDDEAKNNDMTEQTPSLEVPDVEVPDVEVPDVEVPDVEVPDVEVPDVEVPDVEVPDVEVPDISESVSGVYTKDDIKFNLTGAVSVVTTSELAEIPETSSFSSKAISFNSYSAFSDDNTAKTNLFAVNEQGDITPLVNLPGTAKFDYTVSSPDGKYLYALAGINLYDNSNDNYDLLTNTNCSIFKIDTETSDWSCLIENVIAETPFGILGRG